MLYYVYMIIDREELAQTRKTSGITACSPHQNGAGLSEKTVYFATKFQFIRMPSLPISPRYASVSLISNATSSPKYRTV